MTQNESHFQNREFSNEDFSGRDLTEAEFYDCTFRDCDFSDTLMNETYLENCRFLSCNLSNTGVWGARLSDVAFEKSKLLGIKFFECSRYSFSVTMEGCSLNLCNFTDMSMKKTPIRHCTIRECYFQNTYLAESDFSHSQFQGTLFHKADLTKADFRDALGYSIDPLNNRVCKARFSSPEALNLLNGFGVVID